MNKAASSRMSRAYRFDANDMTTGQPPRSYIESADVTSKLVRTHSFSNAAGSSETICAK
jgi:hypothetical protein